MRILLEDLGFTYRVNPDEKRHMSYHCYTTNYFDKIFVDVNLMYTIEMFLEPGKVQLDRWRWDKECKLYIVTSDAEFSVSDPTSIPKIVNFVEETISLS